MHQSVRRVDRRDHLGVKPGGVSTIDISCAVRERLETSFRNSIVTAAAWSGRPEPAGREPGLVLARKSPTFSPSTVPPHGEVVDRPLRREAEREPDVAELQVEVDDHRDRPPCASTTARFTT